MPAIPHEGQVPDESLCADTARNASDWPALARHVTAEYVVIGAGFTGLSAALHAAEAGLDVFVLEVQTPGWGASGRNGRQVDPGLKFGPKDLARKFGDDLGSRVTRLSGSGGDLVFDLIARHGIDCDASRVGWIGAAHTAKALAGLRDLAAEWREIRFHQFRQFAVGSSVAAYRILDRLGA